jgi:hypothetical protein
MRGVYAGAISLNSGGAELWCATSRQFQGQALSARTIGGAKRHQREDEEREQADQRGRRDPDRQSALDRKLSRPLLVDRDVTRLPLHLPRHAGRMTGVAPLP